jgi:hypothetical protein
MIHHLTDGARFALRTRRSVFLDPISNLPVSIEIEVCSVEKPAAPAQERRTGAFSR